MDVAGAEGWRPWPFCGSLRHRLISPHTCVTVRTRALGLAGRKPAEQGSTAQNRTLRVSVRDQGDGGLDRDRKPSCLWEETKARGDRSKANGRGFHGHQM